MADKNDFSKRKIKQRLADIKKKIKKAEKMIKKNAGEKAAHEAALQGLNAQKLRLERKLSSK